MVALHGSAESALFLIIFFESVFVNVVTILRSLHLCALQSLGDVSCCGEYCLPYLGALRLKGLPRGGASPSMHAAPPMSKTSGRG